MERGEELMQLNRVAFDRNTQAFERLMVVLDRHEQLFEESRRDRREIEANREDLKTFIREMNVRAEKRFQDWSQRNNEFMAEMSAKTNAILREMEEGREESREESRAQREALLALIDRLPPPAQAA
jgi:hypothetical protein